MPSTAKRKSGISVYNRSKGKPIVNSADAGDRITNVDLAAANDAIVIALCSKAGVPSDNDERMMYCQELLERGMEQGMDSAKQVLRDVSKLDTEGELAKLILNMYEKILAGATIYDLRCAADAVKASTLKPIV